jgi:hypothetical protein
MSAPNFELITELQVCIRRDFPLVDSTILNPYNAAPLVEGEWLEMDSSTYQLKRGSSDGTSLAVWPVHTERGRYDTQAVQKVNVLFAGMYEADTLIHGTTSGLGIGDPLMVSDVTISSISRRALIKATTGKAVVGLVTKIDATTGKLRFLHMGNWLLKT